MFSNDQRPRPEWNPKGGRPSRERRSRARFERFAAAQAAPGNDPSTAERPPSLQPLPPRQDPTQWPQGPRPTQQAKLDVIRPLEPTHGPGDTRPSIHGQEATSSSPRVLFPEATSPQGLPATFHGGTSKSKVLPSSGYQHPASTVRPQVELKSGGPLDHGLRYRPVLPAWQPSRRSMEEEMQRLYEDNVYLTRRNQELERRLREEESARRQ